MGNIKRKQRRITKQEQKSMSMLREFLIKDISMIRMARKELEHKYPELLKVEFSENCKNGDLVFIEDGKAHKVTKEFIGDIDTSPKKISIRKRILKLLKRKTMLRVEYTPPKPKVAWVDTVADTPRQLERHKTYISGKSPTWVQEITVRNYLVKDMAMDEGDFKDKKKSRGCTIL